MEKLLPKKNSLVKSDLLPFLTLEGGEGAGKSTLLRFIDTYLKEQGYETVTTREPGGSFLGEEIRELLLHPHTREPISDSAELFLFLASRAQHVKTLIEPAIKEGKIVLCDRFNDSTIAYQAAARGLEQDTVEELCLAACGSTLPSLTIYLDVDPLIGMKRASKRNTKENQQDDRLEQEGLAFHKKVRTGFLSLAKQFPDRIHVIDSQKPPKTVQAKAQEILHTWINKLLKNIS